MKFRSVASGSSSSTTMGQEFAQALLQRDIPDWRGDFRSVFRELTRLEFSDAGPDLMRRGLKLLTDSVVDDDGTSVLALAEQGWASATDDIVTVVWQGAGPVRSLEDLSTKAAHWVEQHLAEPGFYDAAIATSATTESAGLLVALAAGAECAPTRLWIEAGGSLAPVMRPNPTRWKDLLSRAADGARVYVPIRRSALVGSSLPATLDDIAAVAGVDITSDVFALAAWISSLRQHTSSDYPMILAGFGYSAGASHVVLQAAQDALMSVAVAADSTIALAWLGTPTDSLMTPLSVFDDRLQRHTSRSAMTKIRDAFFDSVGIAHPSLSRPPVSDTLSYAGQTYSLLDCSADMQGPNYLIAKRSQRWRAMVAAADGIKVAYCLTPAARTHSVLDFRILRATYRGAPRFGVVPFSVADTEQVTARLLLGGLAASPSDSDPTDVYLKRAVHGGLWRCIYEPQAIWRPATITGWPALLRRGF